MATGAAESVSLPALVAALVLTSGGLTGCTWITYLGTDTRGSELGKTYYVGGAGPFGHVGTIDVPKGLRRAGYRGAIEAFGWQSIVGGTLRDQVDRSRNEEQAQRLARRIEAYLLSHPDRRVNIIALSAGTGVATWALEALPAEYHVGTVVFLGSSLSRDYDLGAALSHVDEKFYSFYSPDDPILRLAVPIAGSVDRETHGPNLAGLLGFKLPDEAEQATAELYQRRLLNRPYRKQYRAYGYRGMHTDSTTVRFVQNVIAPLLLRPIDAPATSAAPESLRQRRAPAGK